MKKKSSKYKVLSLLACLTFAATSCFAVTACSGSEETPEASNSTPAAETHLVGLANPTTSVTHETHLVGISSYANQAGQDGIISRATLMSTGDILLHSTFLGDANNDGTMDDRNASAYYNSANDSYDFSPIFQYVQEYYKKADFAIANLEVTLCGDDKIDYGGYPLFNSPDAIAYALKDAGIDMVLTATNHIADTDYVGGFDRTQSAISAAGLEYTGTQPVAGSKKYSTVEINGIKIGIVNYVYSTYSNGTLTINGIEVGKDLEARINHFDYNNLDALYSELREVMAEMKADGIEAYVFYPHWGEEYQLKQNGWQDTIAENVADLGFTAIVGNHTHCVEPTAVLTNKDGQKIPVLFSMGNEVSNQRKELMDTLNDGHTEDSLLYYLTFAKRADGTVFLESTDAVPTWTHMYLNDQGKRTYEIVPLERNADWTKFNLSASNGSLSDAQDSFRRTAELVGPGINQYCGTVKFENVDTLDDNNDDTVGDEETF